MTATYRLLEDHYINNALLPAGTVVTDTGAGAQIPPGWKPTPACDPLTTDAVTQFYAEGPKPPGLTRSQFVGVPVEPPRTYWLGTPMGSVTSWQLKGLGAGLPPIMQ